MPGEESTRPAPPPIDAAEKPALNTRPSQGNEGSVKELLAKLLDAGPPWFGPGASRVLAVSALAEPSPRRNVEVCVVRYYGKGWEVSVHAHNPDMSSPAKIGVTAGCSCFLQTNDGDILQIDIDRPATASQERKSRQRITRVLERAKIPWSHMDSRETPHGYHIRVRTLLRLTPTERVALQALCGSDFLREAATLHRIRCWSVEPDLLFDAKSDLK